MKTKIKKRSLSLFILMGLLFTGTAFANNIQVSNVQLVGAGTADAYIQFDISWDNSWSFSSNYYHDAAWVFAKYAIYDDTTKLVSRPYAHVPVGGVSLATEAEGTLGTTALNVVTDNTDTGGEVNWKLPNDYRGFFLYHSLDGTGTFTAKKIKLAWNMSAISAANPIVVKVFAMEMVYVPQGAFYLGSGGTESGSFTDGAWSSGATIPFKVSSENEITINTGAGNLWGTSTSGNNTIGLAGTLPEAFPKGYNGFYCMKYELTQGQYCNFLNTLSRAQQINRNAAVTAVAQTSVGADIFAMNNAALAYRSGIRSTAYFTANDPVYFYCDLNNNKVANEANDGQWQAMNYLSWADLCAYADWAGLRPMTELEFEKAARGPKTPVVNEYAWGLAGGISQVTGITNSGQRDEIAANSGNCVYGSHASVQGPMRSGFAATVSTATREATGASFYGIMELSGNLWERTVSVGENTVGRKFTGLHGDGDLSIAGGANVAGWPGTNAFGAGSRGGSWINAATYARASDRLNAAHTNAYRINTHGGRLVRTSQ